MKLCANFVVLWSAILFLPSQRWRTTSLSFFRRQNFFLRCISWPFLRTKNLNIRCFMRNPPPPPCHTVRYQILRPTLTSARSEGPYCNHQYVIWICVCSKESRGCVQVHTFSQNPFWTFWTCLDVSTQSSIACSPETCGAAISTKSTLPVLASDPTFPIPGPAPRKFGLGILSIFLGDSQWGGGGGRTTYAPIKNGSECDISLWNLLFNWINRLWS